jgi:hypothetical protein
MLDGWQTRVKEKEGFCMSNRRMLSIVFILAGTIGQIALGIYSLKESVHWHAIIMITGGAYNTIIIIIGIFFGKIFNTFFRYTLAAIGGILPVVAYVASPWFFFYSYKYGFTRELSQSKIFDVFIALLVGYVGCEIFETIRDLLSMETFVSGGRKRKEIVKLIDISHNFHAGIMYISPEKFTAIGIDVPRKKICLVSKINRKYAPHFFTHRELLDLHVYQENTGMDYIRIYLNSKDIPIYDLYFYMSHDQEQITALMAILEAFISAAYTETGLAIYKSPFPAKIAGFATKEGVALRSFLEANPLEEGEYIAANNGERALLTNQRLYLARHNGAEIGVQEIRLSDIQQLEGANRYRPQLRLKSGEIIQLPSVEPSFYWPLVGYT